MRLFKYPRTAPDLEKDFREVLIPIPFSFCFSLHFLYFFTCLSCGFQSLNEPISCSASGQILSGPLMLQDLELYELPVK